MAHKSFDYIIVGGGSSGCVMANRLTENDAVSVLLLEAGGKDSHPYIHMPVGFSKLLPDREPGALILSLKNMPIIVRSRMRKARFLVVVPP